MSISPFNSSFRSSRTFKTRGNLQPIYNATKKFSDNANAFSQIRLVNDCSTAQSSILASSNVSALECCWCCLFCNILTTCPPIWHFYTVFSPQDVKSKKLKQHPARQFWHQEPRYWINGEGFALYKSLTYRQGIEVLCIKAST